MRAVRLMSVVLAAVVCVTCADQSVSGVRGGGIARVSLAPVFVVAPPGGPRIDIKRIRGVLRSATDSSIADAAVEGDSAILEFTKVVVHGDSSKFLLDVQARDRNNVVVFSTTGQELQVKPGANAPATPVLDYTAPDATAETIDISVTALALDWAGAAAGNASCLNRVPSATARDSATLSVTGKTAGNQTVTGVRVGWTSRDTLVFTVDSVGLVKARCSNKSAWLVARTFLDKSDSILVTVTAPAFSLLMSRDSASVPRGDTLRLTALVVDENNNQVPAAQVTWNSSDILRATVNSTGLVTAIANGRVLITASSGNRTTVGVIQVVRPQAAKVVVVPVVVLDSLAVGQTRAYFAKALDAANKVIGEATGFQWSTSSSAIATVNATTGLTTAVAVGNAFVKVTIDGKRDSLALAVLLSLPPGSIKSTVTDAATGAALASVTISGPSTSATSAADGSFLLGGLKAGDDITLTKTGYVSITFYSAPVFPNFTLQVPNAPMSPTNATPGVMTGKVVSALTTNGVAGISVSAYAGINAGPTPKRPTVVPNFTATTDASGIYTFSSTPAGVYTLIFKGTGYSDVIGVANAVGGVTRTSRDVLLPPVAFGGGLFIVLTWADCGPVNVPCDLDAHLTGPRIAPDTGRFQVFSGSKSYVVAPDTIAALDVDDSNGRGPEVIGLRPSASVGMYRFYVHNFSNAASATSKALADSASARVDVYQDNHVIGTFFPPSGVAGTVWKVFDYDGARLLPVGQIVFQADASVLALRAPGLPKGRK